MRGRTAADGLLFADEVVESAPTDRFADVALNRPVRCEFTYAVPAELIDKVAKGVRVAVPLGPRREVGLVVRLHRDPEVERKKIKSIVRVLDDEPLVDEELLELTRWMATYYACSWGEALSAILPSALKREGKARETAMVSLARPVGDDELNAMEKRQARQFRMLRTLREVAGAVELRDLCRRLKVPRSIALSLEQRGWLSIERTREVTDPLAVSTTARRRPAQLSDAQETALKAISDAVQSKTYATFLLQGVTGSGKTEVYLRAIEHALSVGRGAIVIVPEIALTPQTVGWFRSRFGAVAVLHSRMTEAQRREMWLAVKRGDARVVVGARSAVFAPVRDLGVIVVDEEHEPSFKQAETPRYHGRDVAVMRARSLGGVCILGSATPSLESWHNASEGRYRVLRLRERVSGGTLPRVEVVDMRTERAEGGKPVLISGRLKELLTRAVERKEQSILFLNRRGFAVTLWCTACGETVRCKQCDVALTYHRRIDRAVCHYCCDELVPPKACPRCTAPALRYLGAGSERIESNLAEILPGARIRRMDSDTMVRHQDYEEVLGSFGRGEIDVLVGTQMIAKGLDFPRVTVVGIISADSSLHLPDFRAAERTFQLLAQVSGRAGRGEAKGEIVVQTVTPAHPAVIHATKHDYEGFAIAECRLRRELGYPPFGRLVRVILEDEDEALVVESARTFTDMLEPHASGCGAQVLGPAEAPIAMLRGRYRQHLLIKVPARADALKRIREALIPLVESVSRPRITIDVDPMALL